MASHAKSDKQHWENVMSLKNTQLKKYIEHFFTTEQYSIFNSVIPDGWKNKTFFEIGAAPGLYGMIFQKYFNYLSWGIEYTHNGYQSILNIFENENESSERFILGDFFQMDQDKKYDIVFSGWFIEHFDNYEEVIDSHIRLTRKWGLTVIVVPKYHIYYKYFQDLLYVDLMQKQHITEIMNKSSLEKIFKWHEALGNISLTLIEEIEPASFWQLVSMNSFIQKCIYGIDFILEKTWIYKILPKDYWSIIVVAKKLN